MQRTATESPQDKEDTSGKLLGDNGRQNVLTVSQLVVDFDPEWTTKVET